MYKEFLKRREERQTATMGISGTTHSVPTLQLAMQTVKWVIILTIILFAANWCSFLSLFFLHRHINLLEGCESADWAGTYGVTASGNGNTKSLSSFIFCHHYFCPHMYFAASSFLHVIVIVIIHEFQQFLLIFLLVFSSVLSFT